MRSVSLSGLLELVFSLSNGAEGFMRVLVTGGAGYIGSHAARALQRRGHSVVIFDNLSTGHESLAKGFELVVGDIRDAAKLSPLLRDTEAVMHFAAVSQVGESVRDPRKYFSNNVVSGLALLDAVIAANIPIFVFSSSAAVYGAPERVPIPEEAPLRPTNPYGSTKVAIELALAAYHRAYGLRFAALRYFNAAGADEAGDIGEMHAPETHLIPSALLAVAGLRPELEVYGTDYDTADGTCVRDYIHVSDLADAHVLALEHLAENGGSLTVNLGIGRGHSVAEVIAAVEKTVGKPVPRRICARRDGDPPVLVADPARARSLLTWAPSRTLPEMIASAWRFLSNHSTAERRA